MEENVEMRAATQERVSKGDRNSQLSRFRAFLTQLIKTQ